MTGLFDLIGMTEEERNISIGFDKVDADLKECKKFLDEALYGDPVETPYFTMEYKQHRVKQIQGKWNREDVPGTVKQAIKKWEKEIKKVI